MGDDFENVDGFFAGLEKEPDLDDSVIDAISADTTPRTIRVGDVLSGKALKEMSIIGEAFKDVRNSPRSFDPALLESALSGSQRLSGRVNSIKPVKDSSERRRAIVGVPVLHSSNNMWRIVEEANSRGDKDFSRQVFENYWNNESENFVIYMALYEISGGNIRFVLGECTEDEIERQDMRAISEFDDAFWGDSQRIKARYLDGWLRGDFKAIDSIATLPKSDLRFAAHLQRFDSREKVVPGRAPRTSECNLMEEFFAKVMRIEEPDWEQIEAELAEVNARRMEDISNRNDHLNRLLDETPDGCMSILSLGRGHFDCGDKKASNISDELKIEHRFPEAYSALVLSKALDIPYCEYENDEFNVDFSIDSMKKWWHKKREMRKNK